MRGIVSILIGGVMIVGGLSGKLALRGTESGLALAGIGAVIAVIGVIRLAGAAKQRK